MKRLMLCGLAIMLAGAGCKKKDKPKDDIPADGPVTKEDCLAVIRHATEIMRTMKDPPQNHGMDPASCDDPKHLAEATHGMVVCMLATTDLEGMEKCMGGDDKRRMGKDDMPKMPQPGTATSAEPAVVAAPAPGAAATPAPAPAAPEPGAAPAPAPAPTAPGTP